MVTTTQTPAKGEPSHEKRGRYSPASRNGNVS
jgi:hypothetical protein